MELITKSGKRKKLLSCMPEDYLGCDPKSFPTEAHLQEACIRYFRSFLKPIFPDAVLIVNPFSESKSISSIEMERAKRVGFERSNPDVIIAHTSGMFCGIALEIKRVESSDITKDLKPISEHAKKQQAKLDKLALAGFKSKFSRGLDMFVEDVSNYFSQT